MKQRLYKLLKSRDYNYRMVIACLKEITEYRDSYESKNSSKRNYTLEEHTEMVCNMFEKWFANSYDYSDFDISSFRIMLCVHDIGKPISLIKNDKYNQYKYTNEMIKRHERIFPLSNREFMNLLSIISDDPIGLYIRGKISTATALDKIKRMNAMSEMDMVSFWDLILLYYQVDAGAYTSLGYIGPASGFIEKPKLEKTFKKDNHGLFVYSLDKKRFQFSDEIEIRIEELRRKAVI